jgi:hypothetical protein
MVGLAIGESISILGVNNRVLLDWGVICPYSKLRRLPKRVNHTWVQQLQNRLIHI